MDPEVISNRLNRTRIGIIPYNGRPRTASAIFPIWRQNDTQQTLDTLVTSLDTSQAESTGEPAPLLSKADGSSYVSRTWESAKSYIYRYNVMLALQRIITDTIPWVVTGEEVTDLTQATSPNTTLVSRGPVDKTAPRSKVSVPQAASKVPVTPAASKVSVPQAAPKHDAKEMVRPDVPNDRDVYNSPHLIARCICTIICQTEPELHESLKEMPEFLTKNNVNMEVNTRRNIITQLYEVKEQSNSWYGLVNDAKIEQTSQSVRLFQKLSLCEIDYTIITFRDESLICISYSVRVSDTYTRVKFDKAATINMDEDASLWFSSGHYVYILPETVKVLVGKSDKVLINSIRLYILNFPQDVFVFATISDAHTWYTTLGMLNQSGVCDVIVDASNAMLAYASKKISLCAQHIGKIDHKFTYVKNDPDPFHYTIISTARGYMDDKVRNLVMHVATGVGIVIPSVFLVATDVYFCMMVCIQNAGIPDTVLAKISKNKNELELLSARFGALITAVCRRDASQMRDTGYRMQTVYADAVTNAQWQLNSYLKTLPQK